VEAILEGPYRPDARYSSAIINVTNRCNLACAHCFVFREANWSEHPKRARDEPAEGEVLALLARLRDRHGLRHALWMGGEPLLRRSLVERGLGLFARNTIATNGTLPLPDFGPGVLYVVSLDGPERTNDAIRGRGAHRRVLRMLSRLPLRFSSAVQVQCTVTRRNQECLAELVAELRATRVRWMTFSFYVPRAGDAGPDAWPDNEARASAVREVIRLAEAHPGFVRNSRRSLELMLPPHAERVTAACLARGRVLPLYLDGANFRTPYCCYGNDVDCKRCGGWVVFDLAARESLARGAVL
jgi:MoaA/NifB/PqqE/SkfB family radical SAM enzyme